LMHMVVLLLWVCSPACALFVEEHGTIELFRGGALRFLRDGRTPVSGDDDAEFFPETGVDGDDGSGLG
jgi:hypothetical protein